MVKPEPDKVLVVDDDPAIRILIRKILSNKYTIIEASNGKEGLDLAQDEAPDLIIMDIMMPEVSGYMACYQLKKDPFTARILVLMISNLDGELNIRFATEMGAAGYLIKSFNQKELLDKVNELLLRKEANR